MKDSDFVSAEKKVVVFGHFSKKNMKGEFNTEKSLVDVTLPVPTLEDYLKQYKQGVFLSSRFEEYSDESEEFQIQDYRDSDIEDIFDYEESLKRKNVVQVKIENKIDNNNSEENEEVAKNERKAEEKNNRNS